MFISQSTPPKLPIARNETVGVYCEVAGIAARATLAPQPVPTEPPQQNVAKLL